MQRDKLRYVFGAATITAIALLLILAFGRATTPATASAPSEDVAALQAENARLVQALRQMQQREAQYRSEIAAANETINALLLQSGLAGSQTQEGFTQPFSDGFLPVAPEQFRDHRAFSDDDRFFQGGGFGEHHGFFESGSGGS